MPSLPHDVIALADRMIDRAIAAEQTPDNRVCAVERYESREEWLEARRDAITGTDAAVITGDSPWVTPFQLYAQKLGIIEATEESEAMRWGVALEPLVAESYAEETGRLLISLEPWSLVRSLVRPWQTASLDRIIVGDPRGPGVLEIKTTATYRAEELAEQLPAHYLIQLQHQLAVTGYHWGSIAILVRGQRLVWRDVERDEVLIAKLIGLEEQFWARLRDHEPPPVDGADTTRTALLRMFPQEVPERSVALPPEADRWDEIRQQADEAIKTQTARKAEAENALRLLIGEAEVGVLPNGIHYTWRTVTKKEYTVPASSTRVLRRKEVRS